MSFQVIILLQAECVLVLNIIKIYHRMQEIKELAASSKLPMPVLALSGDIYPILGGNLPGSSTFNSIQNLSLATNLQGIIVPLSGHWIAEEQPQFFIKQ